MEGRIGMKKSLFVGLSLYIFIHFFSCKTEGNHVNSENLTTPKARTEAVSKYFNVRTEIKDVEFDIYDVNLNNRSIPGPSDRDYKMAFLLPEGKIDPWLSDVVVTSFPKDYSWGLELIKGNDNFTLGSEPEMYTGDNKTVILFRKENILFMRIQQH